MITEKEFKNLKIGDCIFRDGKLIAEVIGIIPKGEIGNGRTHGVKILDNGEEREIFWQLYSSIGTKFQIACKGKFSDRYSHERNAIEPAQAP
ncbi:MAG: hypothetical protein KKG13_03040 [Nanoarchaeota archaeon]|nr:hypothetical protein [Nanoarchaeota archaeon]